MGTNATVQVTMVELRENLDALVLTNSLDPSFDNGSK